MGIFNKAQNTDLNRIESFPGAEAIRKQIAEGGAVSAAQLQGMSQGGYTGDRVAGMTDWEAGSLDTLSSALDKTTPTQDQLYTSAKGELQSTLDGDNYNPQSGEYYQAYRNAVDRNVEEAKQKLYAESSASDSFFGGGRMDQLSNILSESGIAKDLFLGEQMARERDRRLQVAQGTPGFMGQGEALDYGRVEAAQNFGSLPRQLEQASMDAGYQEYVAQMQALGFDASMAAAMATYSPPIVATSSGGPKTWVQDFGTAFSMVQAVNSLSPTGLFGLTGGKGQSGEAFAGQANTAQMVSQGLQPMRT